jgi:L-asparaginase II
MAEPQPLFELTRGSVTESTHYGHIAIVDSNGNLLHSQGDPHTVAFLRSSAKPFQTLPFVEQGGAEHFHYTAAEIALSCASHETSQLHLDTIQGMQLKVGIHESDLQCGPHLPSDAHKLREVIKHDLQPTSNFNNCSGKHTTMLAFAKMRGLPLENYLDPSHPIQREILKTFSEMCSIEEQKIELGTDGCSAPNFAMPLFNSALGMARLCDPHGLSKARATACKKITSAMTAHSEMVSNFSEFDCELMKVGEGRIVTKRGAEGFQIVGILPGVVSDLGIGIAFKVTDGDASRMNDELERSARVRPAVTLEILKQLGALNEAQLKTLAKFGPQKILKNYAGIVTGESRTTFTL